MHKHNEEADLLALLVMSMGGEARISREDFESWALKLHDGYAVSADKDEAAGELVIKIRLV
jgi:hypothetical protein